MYDKFQLYFELVNSNELIIDNRLKNVYVRHAFRQQKTVNDAQIKRKNKGNTF